MIARRIERREFFMEYLSFLRKPAGIDFYKILQWFFDA